MSPSFLAHLAGQRREIAAANLAKTERVITTPQSAHVDIEPGRRVLNLCANNYLGLADHPAVVAAAHAALDRWGYGLASVRFICGTQRIHRDLEIALARFLGCDDAVLYSSCFDANGGLFETLLGPEDAVISDELNHASIIDGIRLCKARRYRYRNTDLGELEARLQEATAGAARFKLIATDGVFSMDGTIAPLREICDLADRHGAAVMVDDSHAAGFLGRTGRGTPEWAGVAGRVDILTGTMGKALGGAAGGYTAARQPIIDLLRQRSRPYLFSNSLPPVVAAATLRTLELLSGSTELRDRLEANTRFYRAALQQAGLDVRPGAHPIVPIMLGDAALAQRFAARMLEKGVYVVGFSHPVVPLGQARIRTQVSAAHTTDDLAFAVEKFRETKEELGL